MPKKEKPNWNTVFKKAWLLITNSIRNNSDLLLDHEKRIKKLEKQLQEATK